MVISNNPKHAGYSNFVDYPNAKVYLNGELLKDVHSADESLCVAWVSVRDERGEVVTRDGKVVTKARRGTIMIELGARRAS